MIHNPGMTDYRSDARWVVLLIALVILLVAFTLVVGPAPSVLERR